VGGRATVVCAGFFQLLAGQQERESANARAIAMKKKPSSKQPLIEHYATAYDLLRPTLYKAYNALQLGMAKSAVKTWHISTLVLG
jgi:uncharacterized membrane-anchored protein YhcB (DUF1043 family)